MQSHFTRRKVFIVKWGWLARLASSYMFITLHLTLSISLSLQKTNFRHFARIPPVDILKLDPDIYRLLVAITELTCVGAIIFLKPRLQVLATYTLLVMMLGALYTHYAVGDAAHKFGGAIFGLVIVLLRLYTMGELHRVTVKID